MKRSIFIIFVFSLLLSCKHSEKHKPEPKQNIEMRNPVIYFEIPVKNMEKAITFYHAVFGFEFEKENIDGNEMALFPLKENETGISGALAKGKTYIPSKNGTLIYFDSENIDETLIRVEKNGGKTLYPKTSIGKLGFVAEFEDCEGNRIAIHQNK